MYYPGKKIGPTLNQEKKGKFKIITSGSQLKEGFKIWRNFNDFKLLAPFKMCLSLLASHAAPDQSHCELISIGQS